MQGERLRYVGAIDCEAKSGRVQLRAIKEGHPFFELTATDNIVAVRTARYNEQPLIVRGPGAGADVSAGGVFSDLLRLSAFLGAPL